MCVCVFEGACVWSPLTGIYSRGSSINEHRLSPSLRRSLTRHSGGDGPARPRSKIAFPPSPPSPRGTAPPALDHRDQQKESNPGLSAHLPRVFVTYQDQSEPSLIPGSVRDLGPKQGGDSRSSRVGNVLKLKASPPYRCTV